MSNSISVSNSIGGYRYIDIGLHDLEKNRFVNFHGTGKEAVFGYKYVRIAGFSHILGYSVSADGRKMGEYCN